MLQLSPLYRIDQGFNKWDLKMYRFRQFCMRFSVLIEFFFGFSVLDDFFYGFAVSNRPQCPSYNFAYEREKNTSRYFRLPFQVFYG